VNLTVIDSVNYSGSLPKCQTPAPTNGTLSFRFRVDQVSVGSIVVDGSVVGFDTALIGANLDAAPVCGIVIGWNSPSERLSIASGRTLYVAWRRIQRSDTDSPGATILYDETRHPLYALIVGTRVDLFADDFGDILPELTLSASTTPICRTTDTNVDLVSVQLSTGTDTCNLDSNSERCCALWGRTYEVQMQAAVGVTARMPYQTVWFTLRAPGFVVSGP